MADAEKPPFVPAPPAVVAKTLGVGQLSHHLLVCAGPACCDAGEGAKTWGTIKRAVAQLNVAAEGPRVLRTKCECLRMCAAGPIVVVYPAGVWYERVTPEVAERIVAEHVVGGRVVQANAFARDDLGASRPPAPPYAAPGQKGPNAE